MAWGLNYFRKDFYARTGIEQVSYTPDSFKEFLTDYVAKLNEFYVPMDRIDKESVPAAINEEYDKTYKEFGLVRPRPHARVKTIFDVAKPLYIMKGGLERYGFGRTI